MKKKIASCLSRELQNMATRRNGAENTNKLLQIFVQIETFTTTLPLHLLKIQTFKSNLKRNNNKNVSFEFSRKKAL